MKLDLSIDELELPESLGAELGSELESEDLARAIEAELAELVEAYGAPAEAGGALDLGRIELELGAGAGAQELGRRLAWQVWKAWTGSLPPAAATATPTPGPRPETGPPGQAGGSGRAVPAGAPSQAENPPSPEVGFGRPRRTITGAKA